MPTKTGEQHPVERAQQQTANNTRSTACRCNTAFQLQLQIAKSQQHEKQLAAPTSVRDGLAGSHCENRCDGSRGSNGRKKHAQLNSAAANKARSTASRFKAAEQKHELQSLFVQSSAPTRLKLRSPSPAKREKVKERLDVNAM